MRSMLVLLFAGAVVIAAGYAHGQEAAAGEGAWIAEPLRVVEGFAVPESVVADPETGLAYVSNIEAGEDAYWDDDGKGFISLMTAGGEMKALRWLDSSPAAPLNSPKGMCLLKGYLYFSDNTRLLKYPLNAGGPVREVPLPYTKRLNDVATDGRFVYVSDVELGRVYKVGPQGGQTIVKAPPMVNGITFHRGRMFGVNWEPADVYELDHNGTGEPQPFGLSEHFKNLDGIEVLDDGTFIVSDFFGNKVSTIAPDRKTVNTLIEIETPADIGIDRRRGLLFVPMFMKDSVAIYALKRR